MMLISVLQTSRPAKPAARANGFTLLEVLVVVAVIAIIAAVSFVGVSNPRDDRLLEESNLFRLELESLRHTALLKQRMLGVQLKESGYQFLQWRFEKQLWEPMEAGPKGSSVHLLKPYMEISWQGRREEREVAERDNNSDESKLRPNILVYPDGKISQFDITLSIKGSELSQRIRGNGYGNIQRKQ